MLRLVLCLAAVVTIVAGHGRVLDPPGRSSIWRRGFASPPNWDDHGLNCGGFWRHHSTNRGKCGICGDPYDMPVPRAHELGGKWGSGIIVGRYEREQVIAITIELTVYHKGYWEFRICSDPRNNNQECFDKHLLELVGGGTKYYPSRSAIYKLNYRLPADLVCDHCVLQWRYTSGNNWGECNNGRQAVGCGNQETFGACSDISIGSTRTLDAPIVVDTNPLPPFLTNSVDEILNKK